MGIKPDEDRSQFCEAYFLVHDGNIKQNTEDINHIKTTLAGLPERLDNMINQIEKLCKAMEKNEDKYVSKEIFQLRRKEVDDKFSTINKSVGAITLLLVSFFIGHITGKV